MDRGLPIPVLMALIMALMVLQIVKIPIVNFQEVRAKSVGNDFIDYNHDGGSIMHELGHTLNLQHGGNEAKNCKPNYVSIMNYFLQFGIPQNDGSSILDFSPARYSSGGRRTALLAKLTENSLDESIILDINDKNNRFRFVQYEPLGSEGGVFPRTCSDGTDNNGNGLPDVADPACHTIVSWPLNGDQDGDKISEGVDWNGDSNTPSPGGSSLSANIDTSGNVINIFMPSFDPTAPTPPNFWPPACTNPSSKNILTDFNDWLSISIPFRQFGDFNDGAINPTTEPEPTLQELLDLQEAQKYN